MIALACIASVASRQQVADGVRPTFGARDEVINDDSIITAAITAGVIKEIEAFAKSAGAKPDGVVTSDSSFFL